MSKYHKSLRHIISENRIYLILGVVFTIMCVIAPRFTTQNNFSTIFKSISLYVLPAIGFTIVMLSGKLDLSIGSIVTLGGVITIGLQPHLGWAASILIATTSGAIVGLINGLLVAKVKVDSFIVTLASMIIVQGLVLKLCDGGTFTVDNFTLSDILEKSVLGILSLRVLITIAFVVIFELLLKTTAIGRGFYAVGANESMAWHAGLPVDNYVIASFIISGITASLGGALFSITINSAPPTMGATLLIIVVAATIIGGTSMAGGKGSVLQTAVAVFMLVMLFNGLSCIGAGYEARQIASGVVLAAIIIYDAIITVRKERVKGQRKELLKENLVTTKSECFSEGIDEMQSKNNNGVMITAIAVVGCVAIVAMWAMYLTSMNHKTYTISAPANQTGANRIAPAESPKAKEDIDLLSLRGSDGQKLLYPVEPKTIPTRPADPKALPEEDPLHWYDLEYAGWDIDKVNMPVSPADGAKGKTVIFLKMVDHPYNTAYSNGMKAIANACGVKVKTLVANSDINIQSQQVDQAINERPDMVIINPVDAQACLPLLKRLNEASIPVIVSNLLVSNEAMQYCLAWTGPDDWGQMRVLAREFAKKMNYEGGYCIVQHRPGGSAYFSRTWAVITELQKIAPKMKLLEKQTTDLEAEKSMQVVSDWITRYGKELKGIFSADDSGTQIGINEAVRTAKREDIIRMAAGNSKVGMDFLKKGELDAITFQTAEGDGALAMYIATQWFEGNDIPKVQYLPIRIITKENVDQYLPPQW